MQLGILNVIQAMELAPELVYPLYIAASVDWYVVVLILLIIFTLSYQLILLSYTFFGVSFVDDHICCLIN